MIPNQLTDFCLNGANGLNLSKRDSVRFSQFFSFFHLFVETRTKLNKSCTKLQINQAVFGRVSVQQNYLYFSKVFKRGCVLQRLIKPKLIMKIPSVEIVLVLKVTVNLSERTLFWVCRSADS